MAAAHSTERPLVLLAGATASGKTDTAVAWAEQLDGEIVGADSVQVYRRLDIGSAKPEPATLRGVRHHLLDVADLTDWYDAARYVRDADAAIADIRARGRVPLVVGGTGLYLRALVYGLAPGLAREPTVRRALEARAAEGPMALAAMHDELAQVDPVYAARITRQDPVRIVRALEVFATTGVPLSTHHAAHAALPPRYRVLFLAIESERASLRTRIEARCREMLARGWIDEVRGLLADGYAPDLRPLQSVGYAEVVRHVVEGATDLEGLVARITTATMHFAKRQRTWFRGERDVTWVTLDALHGTAWRERVHAFARDE